MSAEEGAVDPMVPKQTDLCWQLRDVGVGEQGTLDPIIRFFEFRLQQEPTRHSRHSTSLENYYDLALAIPGHPTLHPGGYC